MQRVDLTGQVFGDFKAVEYLGNKKYRIVCQICGEEKQIQTSNLKKLVGVTCQTKSNVHEISPGDTFGDWTVIEKRPHKKILCRCSCGTEKEILKCNLLNGSQTSCGHNRNSYGDLTGRQINEWTVLKKEGYLYRCRCSCGRESLVGSKDLMSGRQKSCGHDYNLRTDISGQQFGMWNVLSYAGNQMYYCECSCSNHTVALVRKAELLNGMSTSCGCNKGAKARQTLLDRYNEVGPNKVSNPRTAEQIEAVQSRESLEKFIKLENDKLKDQADRQGTKFKNISTVKLSELLGIGVQRLDVLIHQYNLEDMVTMNDQQQQAEKDLISWIKSEFNSIDIQLQDRSVLDGKEIDIYIPQKHLGIEYNGNYWHSDLLKSKTYHQEKTLLALQKGIRLIHIFEYEWKNPEMQQKIKSYLSDILTDSKNKYIVYGRNTEVHEVSNHESYEFQNKYHLQGQAKASIHIGIFDKKKPDEMLGVMTFGKPRFNDKYDYELIRMCFKTGVIIVGGAQKMLKYFIKQYKPSQILTYADLTKFNGSVYEKIGFSKCKSNSLTVPNYVWVETNSNKVLKRYQTTKTRLVELGMGDESETEDSIMRNSGYLKLYDSGQLKFEYYVQGGGEQ